MTVLYIEDERSDREMFARLLRIAGASRGMEVEVYCISAISEIERAPLYDCILLDLSLTNGGTIESINWIRQTANRMPAIVVLSGHAEQGSNCIQAGAEDFVHKPDAIEHSTFFVDRIGMAILRHRMRKGVPA